jgi:quinate dehydrogenase (quinone)
MKKIFLIQFFFVSISTLVYGDNWYTSSGDYDSSKYSSINQINKFNINKLDLAWVYRNGYIPEYYGYMDNNQSTPIFTGTNLIVTSLDGYLISLDPSSGVEK